MEGLFRYITIAVTGAALLAFAAFMMLLLGVRSNRQITPERFWKSVAFLVVIVLILLLMIYLYFL